MIVLIDESGDSGSKLDQGSSRYFTVALVAFEETDEAEACDQRIQLLKKEIGWPPNEEFHFKRNSSKVRTAFLTAVSPYSFFYYGIVLNKEKLWSEGFRNKSSFYKYACGLVFENAKGRLRGATVIVDESGSLDFKRQLATYLRKKMNSTDKVISKVKMQRSEGNNLLQLADYMASVINRSVMNTKKRADEYRRLIAHREMYVQVWPS